MGLKGGILIDADSGPPRYVLWCCGCICHEVLSFIQIGCGHTVMYNVKNEFLNGPTVITVNFVIRRGLSWNDVFSITQETKNLFPFVQIQFLWLIKQHRQWCYVMYLTIGPKNLWHNILCPEYFTRFLARVSKSF